MVISPGNINSYIGRLAIREATAEVVSRGCRHSESRVTRGPGPDLAGGRPGAPGGRPGPSSVFEISEKDRLSHYRVLKIEWFGGRPPVGGRPGAPASPLPHLNPALAGTRAALAMAALRYSGPKPLEFYPD